MGRALRRAARSVAWCAALAGAAGTSGTPAGCQWWPKPRATGVSDSTFVAVMADLRRAVLPGGAEVARDSAGRAAVRDSILRKYRVTPVALESTAHRLAQRPEHAGELLRAIDHKVQVATAPAPVKAPATTLVAPAAGAPNPGAASGPPSSPPGPPGPPVPADAGARQGAAAGFGRPTTTTTTTPAPAGASPARAGAGAPGSSGFGNQSAARAARGVVSHGTTAGKRSTPRPAGSKPPPPARPPAPPPAQPAAPPSAGSSSSGPPPSR